METNQQSKQVFYPNRQNFKNFETEKIVMQTDPIYMQNILFVWH